MGMRRLGVHVSISGGYAAALERAVSLGCTAYQVFSRSPRAWKRPKVCDCDFVRKRLEDLSLGPVCVHAPYLVNLASPDPELRERSVGVVCEDVELSWRMGAGFVVVHPGSGKGRAEGGVAAFLKSLDSLVRFISSKTPGVMLLLENTAGQGFVIGGSIEELTGVVESLGFPDCLGLCLDTCHLFASGYDIGDVGTLEGISDVLGKIGLERVRIIHLNDSKGDLGSRIDRHEHIGLGKIGIERFHTFLTFPAFSHQPIILETPKKSDEDDLKNLEVVRGILGT